MISHMQTNTERKIMPLRIRAAAVLAIFLLAYPLFEMIVYLLLSYKWSGFENWLMDLTHLIRVKLIPALLPAYAQYMPNSFVIGVMAGYHLLKGRALSLPFVVISSLGVCFIMEAVTEFITFLLGVPFSMKFMALMFGVTALQSIVSGVLCWRICHMFALNQSENPFLREQDTK